MTKVPIVLAVEPRLLHSLLSEAISREPDLEVVGEARDPVELLLTVGSTNARVVVQSLTESGESPSVWTHLFAEYPGLLVIGVCQRTGHVTVCEQTITSQPVAGPLVPGILAALRSAEPVRHGA